MGGRLLVALILAAAIALGIVALTASRRPGGATVGGHDHPGHGDRPNVLVFVTDDARAETVQQLPKTRRWLADAGVTFTQAFATTPSCCPSRASIFSGRYVHNHGVRRQQQGARLDQRITLQRYLKDAGYFTAMAGKFLNSWPLSTPPPYFDRFAHANGGYYDEVWDVDGKVHRVPTYSTTFIGDKALEYLDGFERADDARPWFAYLATFAPHEPRVPERRYATATFPPPAPALAVGERDIGDKPGYLRRRAAPTDAQVAAVRTEQLRTLLSVDDLVDRVLRHLQQTGELDHTLVFFLSDNGYDWGEHRWIGKFVPYTESVRIPFIVRWPGRLPAGAVDDRMIATIDIKPTVLDAAGVDPDVGDVVDGRSLLDGHRRDRLLLEYWRDLANAPGVRTWAALRSPTWQYIEDDDQPGVPGRVFREYYDLARDPGMDRNLLADADPANDPPATLGAELAAARGCAGATCP